MNFRVRLLTNTNGIDPSINGPGERFFNTCPTAPQPLLQHPALDGQIRVARDEGLADADGLRVGLPRRTSSSWAIRAVSREGAADGRTWSALRLLASGASAPDRARPARRAGKVFQTGAPTLKQAMNAYLARPKLRSEAFKATVRSYMHNHLRDWMRIPLDEITRSMVVSRHGQLAHIPSGANHMFRALRSIWNHARRTTDLPESPTLAIEWYDEPPDGRIIDDLIEWRHTVESLDNPIHAAYYRLLLFTGLRKSEAAGF